MAPVDHTGLPADQVAPAAEHPEQLADATGTADTRTRARVSDLLFERGPLRAGDISAALGLTPAAIRRHLDAMSAEGVVHEVEPRPVRGHSRGRGRPARLYALTDTGRENYPHAYDDVATLALEYVKNMGGIEAVKAVAVSRFTDLERRFAQRIAGLGRAERVAALVELLEQEGYAASFTGAGSGIQLCQRNCPIQHVAEEFPQLCEAETEVFSRLIGSHVQRLATIAHGDGVCTTHIPGEGRNEASLVPER